MQIVLQKLTLRNFKGMRHRVEVFEPGVNSIVGPNGSGKTTLVDAFMWLLFDKDSEDRKAFEIKTLDEKNQPIHKLEHEVEAEMMINGNPATIKKVYREKWVKPRGQAEEELQGHETAYFWNEVPMKKSEYEARIASYLDEAKFKMITNPLLFNSLHWEKRRATLISIAGIINNDAIFDSITTIENKGRIFDLINVMNTGKSVEDYRKEIANKKRKIKAEYELIPARQDEIKRMLPEQIDTQDIADSIAAINGRIKEIDAILQDGTAATRQLAQQKNAILQQIGDAEMAIRRRKMLIQNEQAEAESNRDRPLRDAKAKLQRLQSEISMLVSDLTSNRALLEKAMQQVEETRANYFAERDKQYEETDPGCCPTCEQPWPAAKILVLNQTAEIKFNTAKAQKLQSIQAEGVQQKNRAELRQKAIDDCETRLKLLTAEREVLEKEIETLATNSDSAIQSAEKLIATDADIIEKQQNIEVLNECLAVLEVPGTQTDNSAYTAEKQSLMQQLQGKQNLLSKEKQRIDLMERLHELDNQYAAMAQEIADLEASEFTCEAFTKAKMEMVQQRVNSFFPTVQWRLFTPQLNGGEVESCDCLINGVPYSDANNAARINAGLEIINVLCDYYNAYAPIFIDNAEAVTTLAFTKSQQVRLYVPATIV